jgi:hypothetical protein
MLAGTRALALFERMEILVSGAAPPATAANPPPG